MSLADINIFEAIGAVGMGLITFLAILRACGLIGPESNPEGEQK